MLGCVHAYVEAGESDYIIETVKYSYKLVFIGGVPPPKDYLANNKSALSKPTFLWEELVRLESLGDMYTFYKKFL